MPFMTWTDKLSVGVKVSDDDHKRLIDLVNRLDDGMRTGQGKEVVGKVLDELVRYTKFHFAREEQMFAKTGYPAAVHKKEHDDLVKQVLDLQARYQKGELALSMETLEFLKNWLVNHIQGTDKKYGPFLNSKGIH
jgi:hemerythrin